MTYLSRDEYRVMYFKERESAGTNLYRIRFCTPKGNKKPLGLFPCEYVKMIHGEIPTHLRCYSVVSPVTNNCDYFEIILKDKLKRVSHMVNFLKKMKEGDEIMVKIEGGYKYKKNKFKHFGFLVGGSGVSPAYQTLHEKSFSKTTDDYDTTKISVFFGAPLLSMLTHRKEFEKFRDDFDDVEINFSLDKQPTLDHLKEEGLSKWTGFVGFADEKKIKLSMPPPGPDTMLLCCGPYGMMKFLKGLLGKMGYTEEMTYFYM